MRARGAAAMGLALTLGLPSASAGQEPAGGPPAASPDAIHRERGFAAVPISALTARGWDVRRRDSRASARGPTGASLEFEAGTPFVVAGDRLVQLAHAPYLSEDRLYVPLQLLAELDAGHLPLVPRSAGAEASQPGVDASESTAGARNSGRPDPGAPDEDRSPGGSAPTPRGADPSGERATSPTPAAGPGPADVRRAPGTSSSPSGLPSSGRRVVVIDPGHGGRDLGALGYGGTREKDVALGVAQALGEALRHRPEYEVHLIRSADEFVPVWDRGELATSLKGERPGVFLSLHANSHPTSRDVQGFETYILADARTAHEERTRALENAPLQGVRPAPTDDDLGSILGELRNLDYQRWSAHLAALVQAELAAVHPGRNRGVSQAPLAAITTSLMPSVLVELGFITNPDEEALLRRADFHGDVARALVRAVDRFFDGYVPGDRSPRTGSRP